MTKITGIEEPLLAALQKVSDFVSETTGTPPSQEEIARALKRYFVLVEIKDNIVMERDGGG